MGGDIGDSLESLHESEICESGTREVRYAFAFRSLDWDAYHQFRPLYPDSMWTTMFDYHGQRGSFGCALDIGTGPGTAAPFLLSRFSQLILSDPGDNNLLSAKALLTHRLPRAGTQKHVSYVHSSAEDIHTHLPPGSVDFASLCMSFHYTRPHIAASSIATALRRGGTLASVTYSIRLKFPSHPRLEELWFSVVNKETQRFMQSGSLFPAAMAGLAQAMTGLDFVGLPEALFEEVCRIYVNVEEEDITAATAAGQTRTPGPFQFVDGDESLWTPAERKIGEKDTLVFTKDAGWTRDVDTAWLKGFLASCQMGFGRETWMLPEWAELERIVQSMPAGHVRVEWPVAMLLARRR